MSGFRKNLNSKAKFYKADIRNLTALRRIMQKDKPEVINHHAAIAEVIASVRNPLPTMAVNVQGTINLLLAGSEVGIKKIIFASTGGAIYGDAQHRPTTEQEPALPVSPYRLSKLLGEECVAYYSRLYGFNYVIFRYPNVYGPRQSLNNPYTGVAAIFMSMIKNNHSPMIFEDGKQSRDFTSVHDITQSNLLSMKSSAADYEVFNVGTGRQLTINDVAQTLLRLYKKSLTPQIVHQFRKGDIRHCYADISKIRSKIGFEPKVRFEEGMKELAEWSQTVGAEDKSTTATQELREKGIVK